MAKVNVQLEGLAGFDGRVAELADVYLQLRFGGCNLVYYLIAEKRDRIAGQELQQAQAAARAADRSVDSAAGCTAGRALTSGRRSRGARGD